MSFKLGPKVLIVNDPAKAQLLFFAKLASGVKRLVETDDDFQTSTAFDDLATSPDTQSGAEGPGFLPATVADDETIAQADFLRILGFVDLEGADIVEVTGAKGVSPQKQVSTVTFTVPGSVVVGEEVTVNIEFKSADLRGEFASHLSDYKRKKQFTLVVKAGETATTLATRLKEQINSVIDSGWASWVTATSSAGVVTLTTTEGSISAVASFEGSAIYSGAVTAAFVETTPAFEGRNTYDQLKGLRLETVNGAYAETHKTAQVPLNGAKYSSYLIKKRVSRPDLAGFNGGINNIPSGDFEFQIFINETTGSAYITNLIKWLNANVAKRTMYTSTTASGVLGGDASTVQTTVDSTEPFTTGLT